MSLVSQPTQITLEQLMQLARVAKGSIQRLYLHWTACRYDQVFDDYHLNIGPAGELYLTCHALTELKAHTWHRNTGAVGITICACKDAVTDPPTQDGSPPCTDFGPCAPTRLQLEKMALVVAVLAQGLGLDIDEQVIMTHYEAAALDGYGPGDSDPDMHWDLWYVKDNPYEGLVQGGPLLRGKALWYRAWLEKFHVFEL